MTTQLPDELATLDPRALAIVLRFLADHHDLEGHIEGWASTAEAEWAQAVAKEDATKVVFEIDLGGRRVNVSALNDKGSGHGYRLCGPKFTGTESRLTASRVLDERDVEELRIYLRIWDRIQARKNGAASLKVV